MSLLCDLVTTICHNCKIMALWRLRLSFVSRAHTTCTCVGIHPGRVGHVADGGTPGSTVLCELAWDIQPILSPSCVAEESRSEERFQVCLDRGSPCLRLASSSSAPRSRWCGKEEVLDQLTFGTFCSMAKPVEPSLQEQSVHKAFS